MARPTRGWHDQSTGEQHSADRCCRDRVHSKAEALASDDAESTARDAEPSTNVWTIRSLRLTPKVFLISALGLAVVGTLFGILMKMAAARRRRLFNDPTPTSSTKRRK